MGKRPINSGMRPYAIRSLLSTWKSSPSQTSNTVQRIILTNLGRQMIYLRDPKLFILTDSSRDEVTAASITPPALMLARTGAPNPIDESCLLAKHNQIPLLRSSKFKHNQQHSLTKESTVSEELAEMENYLSEMVFSKSTNAPPHIKRMSLVSI